MSNRRPLPEAEHHPDEGGALLPPFKDSGVEQLPAGMEEPVGVLVELHLSVQGVVNGLKGGFEP